MNRPRALGTAAESAVVRAITPYFPRAERRQLRGVLDAGDITGTPGVAWSVKGGRAAENASDGDVEAWLERLEAMRVNAKADVGVLVMKRKGIGYANAGRWWAVMPVRVVIGKTYSGVFPQRPVRLLLSGACELLADAGYCSRPAGGSV